MPAVRQHSGLQKDVLSLYRRILRQAVKMDRARGATTRPPPSFTALRRDSGTLQFAREEFRRQAQAVLRSDFQKIEYLMRQGEKRLKSIPRQGITHIQTTQQLHKNS